MIADPLPYLVERCAVDSVMDRYCLALFEADADKLLSLYWPDAYEEHGEYKGSAAGFVAFFAPILQERTKTVATLSYRDIVFTSPTTLTALGFGHIVVVSGTSSATTSLVATRYKDWLEQRNGEWRIVHREAGMITKREI